MLVFVVFVAGRGTEHCSDGHIVQTKVQQLYINKHQPAAPQARCSKNTLRSLLPVTSSWIWTRCKPTTPAGLWTVWTLKFSRLFRHVQCNNSFSANLKVSVQIIFFTVFTLVFLFWSFPSLQLIIRMFSSTNTSTLWALSWKYTTMTKTNINYKQLWRKQKDLTSDRGLKQTSWGWTEPTSENCLKEPVLFSSSQLWQVGL